MSKLLVVVDMQKDFIDGALGTKDAQKIVPNVIDEIKNFDGDVVFTFDTHSAIYLETQEGKKLPVPHCIKDTEGWMLDSAIEPFSAGKKCFYKPTFGSVELANFVADSGYTDITLIGLCTDICVISNAMLLKAYLPEANISVKASCCAGVTPQSHETALSAMKMCQIEII